MTLSEIPVSQYEETIKAMRERCHRAVLTLCSMPSTERLGFASQWAVGDIVRKASDAYGYEIARRRFRATPKDVGDYLTVMSAMALYRQHALKGDRDFRIIWARAFETPWWRIKEELELPGAERTFSRWQDRAVEEIIKKRLTELSDAAQIRGVGA